MIGHTNGNRAGVFMIAAQEKGAQKEGRGLARQQLQQPPATQQTLRTLATDLGHDAESPGSPVSGKSASSKASSKSIGPSAGSVNERWGTSGLSKP